MSHGWEVASESEPSCSKHVPPSSPLSWCDRCGQAKEAVQKAKNAGWLNKGESRANPRREEMEVDLRCVERRRETLLAPSLPRIDDSHGVALQAVGSWVEMSRKLTIYQIRWILCLA